MNEIKITWNNPEQTILLFEFPLAWMWADFANAQKVAGEMMDSRTHELPVGIVFILPEKGKLPPIALTASRQALALRDQRVVKIVMVGGNQLTRTMWESVIGLFLDGATDYGLADSVDAAMAIVTA